MRAVMRGSWPRVFAFVAACIAAPVAGQTDAPARQDQLATRLQDRGPRAARQSARDGAGLGRHAVRGIDASRQRLRNQAAAGRAGAGDDGSFGPEPTYRRRVSRRRALCVGHRSRLRFDDIEHRLDAPPTPVLVSKAFPNSAGHGGKFIAFGPDGKLYVPSGAPCNICEPDSDRYANLMRMNPDGSALEVFARGIRNTVGFDWDPRYARDMVHRQWPRHAGR